MENFTEHLLKYKKDPLTLIHKMQELMQQKNHQIQQLESKINFMQLPMKTPIVYHSMFIFNGPPPINCEHNFFITLTFDQKHFLPKTEGDQVNFFINLLYETHHIYQDMYGCFEHHKSGIVHYHGTFQIINNTSLNELLLYFRNKLTIKSSKSVNCKSIEDITKLHTDYMVKENFITIEKKIKNI